MINKKIFLLVIIILVISPGCTNQSYDRSGDLPGITIPIGEMGKAFSIEDPPVLANSYKNGEGLEFQLHNLSDKAIVFPPDYGLKMFWLKNMVWNSVQNNIIYTGYEKILPTHDSFPPGLFVEAFPYIQGLKETVNIRIVMIGYYESSDTAVGAYIDITLIP